MFNKLRVAASIVGLALLCVMVLFTLTSGTAQAAVASPASHTTVAAPLSWHPGPPPRRGPPPPPHRGPPPRRYCPPPDWWYHRHGPPPRYCPPPPHHYRGR